MKTKYNIIINWIIMMILAVPLLALIALKYDFKVISRVVEAAQAVVKCSINYIRTLCKELVEILSIKVYQKLKEYENK